MQIEQYLPVLILLILAVVTTAGMLILSVVLGKVGKRNEAKDTAYECGNIPSPMPTTRYPIKFYIVALVFILFDVEVVFFYPWAVSYKSLMKSPDTADIAFISMLAFILILVAGFIYSVKKGSFIFYRKKEG